MEEEDHIHSTQLPSLIAALLSSSLLSLTLYSLYMLSK
jgi:hypothetical protein